MSEYTPTPWAWTNERNPVFESDDRIIAHRYNLHNELVEALYNLHALYTGRSQDIVEMTAHDIAREVLAKVKGEKR